MRIEFPLNRMKTTMHSILSGFAIYLQSIERFHNLSFQLFVLSKRRMNKGAEWVLLSSLSARGA